MTAIEIMVTLGGLLIGYWVVANLVLADKRQNPAEPSANASEEQVPAGSPDHEPWHVVLKVPSHATMQEIQAAYRTLIRQYHPDKVSGLGDEIREVADRRSKEINAAYQEAMRERGHG